MGTSHQTGPERRKVRKPDSQDYDEEIGKFYFGARYYDPFLGLWMSPDPAEQFANPYTYGGDPVNYVDPDGRFIIAFIASTVIQIHRHGWNPCHWKWNEIGNATMAGLVAGMPGGASLVTFASFASRMYYSDYKWGVLTDYISGGFLGDAIGHQIGLMNAAYTGGTMDWYSYRGNVVYSGGLVSSMLEDRNAGGFAHFGHAIFVDDRNNKTHIAHEMRHALQMEKKGNRIEYYYRQPLKISQNPPFTNKLIFSEFSLVTKTRLLYGPAQFFRPERQT